MMSLLDFTLLKACPDAIKNNKHFLLKKSRSDNITILSF